MVRCVKLLHRLKVSQLSIHKSKSLLHQMIQKCIDILIDGRKPYDKSVDAIIKMEQNLKMLMQNPQINQILKYLSYIEQVQQKVRQQLQISPTPYALLIYQSLIRRQKQRTKQKYTNLIQQIKIQSQNINKSKLIVIEGMKAMVQSAFYFNLTLNYSIAKIADQYQVDFSEFSQFENIYMVAFAEIFLNGLPDYILSSSILIDFCKQLIKKTHKSSHTTQLTDLETN